MKTSSVYLIYIVVGVMTGLATSITVCAACGVAVSGNLGTNASMGISGAAFAAELVAPLLGGFVGSWLARGHNHKPTTRDNDTDNPYPPVG